MVGDVRDCKTWKDLLQDMSLRTYPACSIRGYMSKCEMMKTKTI